MMSHGIAHEPARLTLLCMLQAVLRCTYPYIHDPSFIAAATDIITRS
jgi:hypothetical protein